ncbi:hypothetical protein HS088_TW17G00465 [Tripterygium wilfordii]|uniref:Uncharacterized protein n=1 Tax=Tripterygium wilfordii TaxID=458696 RepID=A0A7J7CFU0_TRIWF|nr:uncharacterized protein LOC119982802 [Tripterygium wilfordii]XP_038682299.1 uncharacterized protein LOC119982802 [Tripterygium wilfordii]KAF5732932.1 hypothetical protein HS088_TW17G00465 [Tripterygium wilfordii]
MKPESKRVHLLVKKPSGSSNGENVQKETAPCFDFSELSEALNGTKSTVETPTDSNSPYDLSLLSQALNAAEKDNNAKEATMVRLNARKGLCKKIHGRRKFIHTDISWPQASEHDKIIFPIMVRMMHIVALGDPARRKKS